MALVVSASGPLPDFVGGSLGALPRGPKPLRFDAQPSTSNILSFEEVRGLESQVRFGLCASSVGACLIAKQSSWVHGRKVTGENRWSVLLLAVPVCVPLSEPHLEN